MISNKITIKNEFLKRLSLVSFACLSVFVFTLDSIGISGIIRTALMAMICYFPLILLFLRQPMKMPYDSVILAISILFLFNLTLIFYPQYTNVINDELFVSVFSLYGGVIGYLFIRLFDNPKSILKCLLIIAWIKFAYYFILSISAIQKGYWDLDVSNQVMTQNYSMSFGYNMLLPTLIFLYFGFCEKKLLIKSIYIILGFIGFLEILMLGSRGASLIVLLFVFLYILMISVTFSKKSRRLAILSLLIFISIVILLFYVDILQWLAVIFDKIGFESRTVDRILQGTILQDNIRVNINNKILNLINENWAFGSGIFADRYYIGSYCHNLFLELLLDFGYIGGSLVILFILYQVLSMLFGCKSKEWKVLFLFFLCCSFFRLLISYSFWIDTNFWMGVGIIVSYKLSKKSAKVNNTALIHPA